MRPKIIIADDDPDVHDLFRLILKKEKYKTTIFSTGDRFLKSADKTKDIPVIMISGSPGIVLSAIQAGADDVIEKSFSTAVLLEKVKGCSQNLSRNNFPDINRTFVSFQISS